MTAVAEIESAIERLSPAEVRELTAWLEEHQQMVNGSAEIFSLYDHEEKAGSTQVPVLGHLHHLHAEQVNGFSITSDLWCDSSVELLTA
jgi:hypothetical protein